MQKKSKNTLKKKLIISIKIFETTYKVNNKKLIISISYFTVIVTYLQSYINM